MSGLPTPSGTTPGTPSGTAGQPAVHSIDEFVFSVPDLEAARHFYASFGLEVRDIDGLIRPYALASVIPAQNLDFFVNLGDVIYENASNLTVSGERSYQSNKYLSKRIFSRSHASRLPETAHYQGPAEQATARRGRRR